MKITIEGFGKGKIVGRNSFGESAYLTHSIKSGDVIRFAGPNGPVNRMIIEMPTNVPSPK